MYSKMDKFLDIETWNSFHPLDEKRFFVALSKIVKEETFNADQMAEYIRSKFGVSPNDDDHYLARAIDHYRDAAWAIRGYLKANNL